MFTFTQTVLQQVLSIRLTTPERLSAHETEIANRICHCTQCNNMWVRKRKGIPDRCPKCHKRNWDRPLLTAIIAAQTITTPKTGSQPQPQEDTTSL